MLGLVMQKIVLPAGKLRQVCVSKKAIQENMRTGKNYPTVLVVENGIPKEYHAANVNGMLQFDPNRTDLPAKVFIETTDELTVFINPRAEQTYLRKEKQPFFLKRWWNAIQDGWAIFSEHCFR